MVQVGTHQGLVRLFPVFDDDLPGEFGSWLLTLPSIHGTSNVVPTHSILKIPTPQWELAQGTREEDGQAQGYAPTSEGAIVGQKKQAPGLPPTKRVNGCWCATVLVHSLYIFIYFFMNAYLSY